MGTARSMTSAGCGTAGIDNGFNVNGKGAGNTVTSWLEAAVFRTRKSDQNYQNKCKKNPHKTFV